MPRRKKTRTSGGSYRRPDPEQGMGPFDPQPKPQIGRAPGEIDVPGWTRRDEAWFGEAPTWGHPWHTPPSARGFGPQLMGGTESARAIARREGRPTTPEFGPTPSAGEAVYGGLDYAIPGGVAGLAGSAIGAAAPAAWGATRAALGGAQRGLSRMAGSTGAAAQGAPAFAKGMRSVGRPAGSSAEVLVPKGPGSAPPPSAQPSPTPGASSTALAPGPRPTPAIAPPSPLLPGIRPDAAPEHGWPWRDWQPGHDWNWQDLTDNQTISGPIPEETHWTTPTKWPGTGGAQPSPLLPGVRPDAAPEHLWTVQRWIDAGGLEGPFGPVPMAGEQWSPPEEWPGPGSAPPSPLLKNIEPNAAFHLMGGGRTISTQMHPTPHGGLHRGWAPPRPWSGPEGEAPHHRLLANIEADARGMTKQDPDYPVPRGKMHQGWKTPQEWPGTGSAPPSPLLSGIESGAGGVDVGYDYGYGQAFPRGFRGTPIREWPGPGSAPPSPLLSGIESGAGGVDVGYDYGYGQAFPRGFRGTPIREWPGPGSAPPSPLLSGIESGAGGVDVGYDYGYGQAFPRGFRGTPIREWPGPGSAPPNPLLSGIESGAGGVDVGYDYGYGQAFPRGFRGTPIREWPGPGSAPPGGSSFIGPLDQPSLLPDRPQVRPYMGDQWLPYPEVVPSSEGPGATTVPGRTGISDTHIPPGIERVHKAREQYQAGLISEAEFQRILEEHVGSH